MRHDLLLLGFGFLLACAGCSSTGSPDANATAAATQQALDVQHIARHRHHRHRESNDSPSTSASSAPIAVTQSAPSGSAFPCNDQQFLSDRQGFAHGQLSGDQAVDVCGSVTRVLPARNTRSGAHGYYDIQVASGVTIEIVCNLDEMNAPAWPWVSVGNYSYAQGRYYYDSATSQGIDWTHHGSSREWPTPGYVVVEGKKYD